MFEKRYISILFSREFEECDEDSEKPVLDVFLYKKLILEALEQLHGQVELCLFALYHYHHHNINIF